MVKGLGSLLILAGFSAVCLGQLRRWRRETETLCDLLCVLELLENRIRLERTPLPRLCRELGEARRGPAGDWLRDLSRRLTAGDRAREAWASSCGGLPLDGEERRLLAELGYKLSADGEGLCKSLLLTRDQLAARLEEKRRCRRDRERQSAALCFSGAALLIILLL